MVIESLGSGDEVVGDLIAGAHVCLICLLV